VCQTVFERASVARTVIRCFGLVDAAGGEATLGAREAAAADLFDVLTLDQPRTDRPDITPRPAPAFEPSVARPLTELQKNLVAAAAHHVARFGAGSIDPDGIHTAEHATAALDAHAEAIRAAGSGHTRIFRIRPPRAQASPMISRGRHWTTAEAGLTRARAARKCGRCILRRGIAGGEAMRRIQLSVVACVLTTAGLGSVYAYQAHYGPSGVTYHDTAKSYGGYTLFTPLRPGPPPDFAHNASILIDMEGNVVKTWPLPKHGYLIENHAYLLENGHLLRRITNDGWEHGWDPAWPGRDPSTSATDTARLQELDWNGNVLYEIADTRPGYMHHHDFIKIWNRKLQAFTILSVASRKITHAQAIALGADPKKRSDYASFPDGIVEFDLKGNVIWEWNITDHLVQDVDPAKPNFGVVRDHPEKLDVNFGRGRTGDWIHINAMDYNDVLGHIVLNNSVDSEFYVIDHDGTFVPGDPRASVALAAGPKGDFLFRWGNPSVYDAGEGMSYSEARGASDGDQQVFFSHDVQWIRPTAYAGGPPLRGAGHFLIFDNGTRHIATGFAYSALLEINPYDGPMDKGAYVRQEKVGYRNVRVYQGNRRTSNQVVWMYASKDPASFWSRHISGLSRLPNGNTLATAATWGQIFEVTPEGEVVWEYKIPTTSTKGAVKVLADGDIAQAFLAYRYGPDHPALRGRTLTPQGKLAD